VSEEDLQLLPLGPNSSRCPNCNTALHGQFCPACGQNQKQPGRFFLHILSEAFEDVFHVDSRAARTLFSLMLKPGFLTLQYFAGRRARYVQPFRLYLITSLLFFFFLSFQTALKPVAEIDVNMDDSTAEDAKELQTGIETSFDSFNISFLTPAQNEALSNTLQIQSEKATRLYTENPGEFAARLLDRILELAPQIMFFLLPLFAVPMKVVYLWSGRYYTEHLILAVHNHCFLFIALLLIDISELFSTSFIAVLTDPLGIIITIWIPIYMYWSLRVYYRQGFFFTSLKFIFLVFSYFSLIILGVLIALMWSVMML
jgi:hypothetical protein